MIYKIPEIRFQPFDKEWEKRNFTEIVKRVSDKSNAAILPRVEFEDIVSNEGRLKIDITNKVDARKGIHFYPGYILYGKLRPYLNNWLFPNFEGIALGDFWVFKTLYGIPAFNYYLIQSDRYQKVANLSSGTKMPRSDWGTVSSTQFYIPGTMEEQFKIGDFLKHLDELIELNQHALDLLRQRKKAFLQKIFPKKGESIPEFRFSGYKEEWSKINLGNIIEIRSGTSGNTSINNGKYRVTRIETISKGIVNTKKTGYINEKPEENYKLNNGDILYSNINSLAHIGKVAIYDLDYELYHGINLLRLIPISNIVPSFLYHFLSSDIARKWAMSHANPAVNQASINQTELSKQILYIPSFKEQEKIGNFFKEMDNSITLQEKKLESLKQMKKAFLQKMFV